MIDLVDLYNKRYSQSLFGYKVNSAVFLSALKVRKESPSTPNHAARLAWANEVRRGGELLALSVSVAIAACLEDETIANDPDNAVDSMILPVVDGAIDDMAIPQ